MSMYDDINSEVLLGEQKIPTVDLLLNTSCFFDRVRKSCVECQKVKELTRKSL